MEANSLLDFSFDAPREEPDELGTDPQWMEKLDPATKLGQILLPGSHDSGAYRTDHVHHVGGARFWRLFKWVRPKRVSDLIDSWAITQHGSIYEQLKAGVRSFDLRVSWFSGMVYVSHLFPCVPLETILLDFKRFLEEHRSEIVVIGVKKDWQHRGHFRNSHIINMLRLFEEHLGSLLWKPNDYPFTPNVTLRQLREYNRRVLFCFQATPDLPSPIEIYHDYSLVEGHWLNTSNVDDAMEKIQQRMNRLNPPDRTLIEVSYVMTANAKDIRKAFAHRYFPRLVKKPIGRESLFHLASEINQKMEEHLQQNRPQLSNINIITFDFCVSNPRAIKFIIDYNLNRESED